MRSYNTSWASIILTTLVFLSVACATASKAIEPGFSECSKQTLQSFLFDQGVPFENIIATDAKYALPTQAWLEDFCAQLKREQQRNGVAFYVKVANNCTKFSRFAAAFAGRLWLKDPARLKDRAICVGQVFFYSGDEVGHAVNCAITRAKGGALKLIFIEPQVCAFVHLEPEQYRTGIFIF